MPALVAGIHVLARGRDEQRRRWPEKVGKSPAMTARLGGVKTISWLAKAYPEPARIGRRQLDAIERGAAIGCGSSADAGAARSPVLPP
jgi:hypothetical protein